MIRLWTAGYASLWQLHFSVGSGSAFSLLTASHIINGVVFVTPCELNVIITILTNHFYTTLSREDFICLSVFLNELSKSMFTTTLFQGLCDRDGKPRL